MIPLLLFLAAAGATGYALHKKRWGWFFFGCAFMAWLLMMQILNVYVFANHGSLLQ